MCHISGGFQADQRFVWNGNLLRELAAQPEVTHVAVWFSCCFVILVDGFLVLV